MPLNLTDALNQYGFVGDLANSIPELKGIFAQAAREGWDPARFQRAVMDSGWWKTNAESVRQLATLHVTDPATYQMNLANARHKIEMMAGQMGRTIDVHHFTINALLNNWDDEQIRSNLARFGGIHQGPDGSRAGDAAQLQAHMRGLVANYGIPSSEAWLTDFTNRIQSGVETLDGFESVVQARAKAQFPHLASQIDAGMTVRDIADPYISTMANTLEVSETEIDLNDSWVKRALSDKSPDGVLGALPLWQFERQLKDDPRWDKTKQAREQAFDTVAQVGRDFGFLAGGS